MDFIQNVLNGMASRRPRLDALRDSWQDLDTHYDRWRRSSGVLSADDGAGKTNSCTDFIDR
jgi:acyl carrier protein phosphodiesterase